MLEEISVRQQKLGLSTRKFAEQLDVSPTLLSLVLNKKRAISGDLTVRIRRWFNTPMATGGFDHPSTVYTAFISERASFVSSGTLRYYREKLEPFIVWCEHHDHLDMDLSGLSALPQISTELCRTFRCFRSRCASA